MPKMPKEYTNLAMTGTSLLANALLVSSPIQMIFLLTALSCHALASLAKDTLTTRFIYHLSGIVVWETLLCMILAQFPLWCYYVINLLTLLLTLPCFKDEISHFLHPKASDGQQNMQDLESQSGATNVEGAK